MCVCVCACVRACMRACVCTGPFHGFLKGYFNINFTFEIHYSFCVCACFHIGCSAGRINHSIYYSFDNCTGFLPTLGLCLNKDSSI